jgi:RNA polymerase sigma factor (TIGR02999 family)
MAGTHEVTRLLESWRGGDEAALGELVPIVHDELRRIARRALRREAGRPLQTTELVNEAFLRLVGRQDAEWQGRAHFLAVAARVMRHLLVDMARRRHAERHGGAVRRVTFDAGIPSPAPESRPEVLDLDAALSRLAERDPRKARIVELRYFAGMTIEETAEALSLSTMTVSREWAKARAHLYRELRGEEGEDDA